MNERRAIGTEALQRSIDEWLEAAGIGTFHWMLLAVCGLANASDAIELLAVSFVLPTTSIEMSDVQKAWLSSIFQTFAGMMLGGWVWGSFADVLGRRRVMSIALIINGSFALLCAFVNSYTIFLLFRLLSGVGVGGSIPVVFVYFSEFFGPSQRSRFIVALSFCWVLGSVFTAGLAWLVYSIVGTSTGWRVFLVLAALPSLAAAVMLQSFPRSPRFVLTVMDDHEECLTTINYIRKYNGLPEQDELTEFTLSPTSESSVVERDNQVLRHSHSPVGRKRYDGSLAALGARTTELFTAPAHRRQSILLSAAWFTLSWAFYGFTLWSPQYLSDRTALTLDEVLMSSFIASVAQIPGCILSVWTVEHFGVRETLAGSMLATALSAFGVLMSTSDGDIAIAVAAFSGVGVAGWNALDILSTEAMPVELRSTAFGAFAAVGRLGAISGLITFGFFQSSHPLLPLICVAMLLVIGSVFVMKLQRIEDE